MIIPSFDIPSSASPGVSTPVSNSSTTAPIRITSGVTWLNTNSPKIRPTTPNVNWAGEMMLFCQERSSQGMIEAVARDATRAVSQR